MFLSILFDIFTIGTLHSLHQYTSTGMFCSVASPQSSHFSLSVSLLQFLHHKTKHLPALFFQSIIIKRAVMLHKEKPFLVVLHYIANTAFEQFTQLNIS